MFFDEVEYTEYKPYRAGVTIANGAIVWTKGRGTVEMEWILPDGTTNIVSIKDVLHVPDLTCGLFSIGQATRKGIGINFLVNATINIIETTQLQHIFHQVMSPGNGEHAKLLMVVLKVEDSKHFLK